MEQNNEAYLGRLISAGLDTADSNDALSAPNSTKIISESRLSIARETCGFEICASQERRQRLLAQNFLLIWMGTYIKESKDDCQDLIEPLRRIVNTIHTFADTDSCIEFLSAVKDEKIFLIVSDKFVELIVPYIHDAPQLLTIYVLSENSIKYENWKQKWAKLKSISSDINQICVLLKEDTQQCDRDSLPITFMSGELNCLDSSFMYTQLLKEILVKIEHDDKDIKDFTNFCRAHYHENLHALQIIDEFEREYGNQTSILWYTRESFIYQMLNRALRLQEINNILKMGFFIRDLHEQIQKLYIEPSEDFIVYRGQGLSQMDFEAMRAREGGLISFNNFLSTSTDRQVSLLYAESARQNLALIGILFEIHINARLSSIPFVSLDKRSFFHSEKEILFSMHTIFRIVSIEPIDDRLWQVKLTSTNDDDVELKRLTEFIRQETQESSGWYRLGQMLIRMGNFDKAEEVYQVMLDNASGENEREMAYLHDQLGCVKSKKGNYNEALMFNEKSLEIRKRFLAENHPDMGATYHRTGQVYDKMGEYTMALNFYHQALEIQQTSLASNHSNIAMTYNSIGLVYKNMGEYSKSLDYYQKDLDIKKTFLPLNHPDFATTYNSMGMALKNLKQYAKALEFYEDALKIRRKCLPLNHPDLATTYDNIGQVYDKLGQYSKALESYTTALEMRRKCLPSNHPNLGGSYNNLGLLHYHMRQYEEAFNFYRKAVKIKEECLPPKHKHLGTLYYNIGLLCEETKDFSKALIFFKRAVEVGLHSLPPNHPHSELYQKHLTELQKRM